jgi:4-diphosphocytidyl-2-C-methyl-D-erythritol kinase
LLVFPALGIEAVAQDVTTMRLWRSGQPAFVRSPAKLNLFLEIHGKRADGYHELETLMVPVAMTDSLSFETEDSNESRLRIIDAGARLTGSTDGDHRSMRRHRAIQDGVHEIPTGPDNLILRAVRAVREYTGVDRQVRMTAWKRIPPASGMAGGSGNAAATLLGLNRFWDLGLTRPELLRLGASLGSDVNFFLTGCSAAVCRGRGETIEPVPFPNSMYFVIVRPPTGLSTAAVYRQWKPAGPAIDVQPLLWALQRGRVSAAAKLFHNALEKPATELNADVAALKNLFGRLPFQGRLMTGSGTACFGVCANRRLALGLAGRLRALRVGRVFVTRNQEG